MSYLLAVCTDEAMESGEFAVYEVDNYLFFAAILEQVGVDQNKQGASTTAAHFLRMFNDHQNVFGGDVALFALLVQAELDHHFLNPDELWVFLQYKPDEEECHELPCSDGV